MQDLFPRDWIGQEIHLARGAESRRQEGAAAKAPRGRRHGSGAADHPGDRPRGDYAPTREIITQASLDMVLMTDGVITLEIKADYFLIIIGSGRPG
jgi:hypothetical protein